MINKFFLTSKNVKGSETSMKKGMLLEVLVVIGALIYAIILMSSYLNVKADETVPIEENVSKEIPDVEKNVDDINDIKIPSEENSDTKNSNQENDDDKSMFEEFLVENKAANDTDDIDGDGEEGASQGKGKYVSPSPRPLKSLGMIIRAGFFVQPSKEYYVKEGKSIIIKSKFKESIWNRLSGVLILKDPVPNYRWRYSEDMEHWLRFKKKVAHSKNYEFKAKKAGKYYFQSRASSGVLLGLGALYYYSEVATVHVVKEPKNIVDLKVKTEEDYLYNLKGLDNITTAHETIEPKDATGYVEWSGDNNTLARIDPISGEIEANQKGISGEYTVTGTFINNDGTKLSANTKIEIGGGLDDETVHVGENATFKLKGVDQEQMMDEWRVEWYEQKKGKDKKLKSGEKDPTFTIEKTTIYDHQRKIYAKVYAKTNGSGNQKEHSFETRVANLNVLNLYTPNISFDVEVENLTYKDENHKHNTDKVMQGDRIKITSSMNNENPLSVLKYGVFELPLQPNMKEKHIKSVVMDGKKLKNKDFSVSNDDGCPHVRIENIDFVVSGNGEGLFHVVEVEFDAREPDETMNFVTQPRIHGNTKFDSNDSSDNAHNYANQSPQQLLINYTNDKLTITPNKISFGEVSNLTSGEIVNRTNYNDKLNSVVVINDNRRKNCKHNLSVSQKSKFKCESNGATLPVSLRYYDEDGGFTILDNGDVPIPDEDIIEDDMSGIDSINWEKNCGLLMHVDETDLGNIAAGTYHAKLEWTAMDVI
ncbi:hypothetical protein [Companilactobacillus baiquanensis]|uniref:Ig-like domain-containing protein n=1 Tax=Companilactobacillus baiquanensis TaxID=2486005 RepID=A0ABW1UXS7_9LACO|nr:hypothetical protein [Companilactobacillus baiquanensis]